MVVNIYITDTFNIYVFYKILNKYEPQFSFDNVKLYQSPVILENNNSWEISYTFFVLVYN